MNESESVAWRRVDSLTEDLARLSSDVGRVAASTGVERGPNEDLAAWALRGIRERIEQLESKLVASVAMHDGMVRVAKCHADRAARAEAALGRALASRMFGEDPMVLDRMGALHYLRSGGLPEATPDDLDEACEGLPTPWGGPAGSRSLASAMSDAADVLADSVDLTDPDLAANRGSL